MFGTALFTKIPAAPAGVTAKVGIRDRSGKQIKKETKMRNDMRSVVFGAVLHLAVGGPLLIYGTSASAEHHEGMMAMESKADHEKMAAMYEDEVKFLKDKIALHERMAKGYQSTGRKFSGASMVNHCKSIVASYNTAIEDNQALAKHHHEMAAAAEK